MCIFLSLFSACYSEAHHSVCLVLQKDKPRGQRKPLTRWEVDSLCGSSTMDTPVRLTPCQFNKLYYCVCLCVCVFLSFRTNRWHAVMSCRRGHISSRSCNRWQTSPPGTRLGWGSSNSVCVCIYRKASESLLTTESRQILLKTCMRLLKLYTITFTEAQTHERVTL